MGFASLAVLEKAKDSQRLLNSILAMFLTLPAAYLTAPSGVTCVAFVFFISVAVYSSTEYFSPKFCASYAAFSSSFLFSVYFYSNGVRLKDYFDLDWISVHLVLVMVFHSYFASRYIKVGFNWLYVLSTFSWSFLAQLASLLMMFYTLGEWGDFYYVLVFIWYGFIFAFFGALTTISAQWMAGGLHREMQQRTRYSIIISVVGVVFLLPYGVTLIMAIEQIIGLSEWDGRVFCGQGVFCLKDRMLAAFSSTVTLTFSNFSPVNGTAKVFATLYAWWGYVWALVGLSWIIKPISGSGR